MPKVVECALVKGEFAEIHFVLGGGDQVHELAHLCQVAYLAKRYEQRHVDIEKWITSWNSSSKLT